MAVPQVESAIRKRVRAAVSKLPGPLSLGLGPDQPDSSLADPLTKALRGDHAWPDYAKAFET